MTSRKGLLFALSLVSGAGCGAPGVGFAARIPDAPLLLRRPAAAVAPESVELYVGRPARRYEALALLRVCSTFQFSEKDLREQAASIGANAIIERGSNSENGMCLTGIAVRFTP